MSQTSSTKSAIVAAIAAVASFKAGSLSLGGLVARLENTLDVLKREGSCLSDGAEQAVLQLEIINALIASGDQPELTQTDRADIDSYLGEVLGELHRFD